MTSVLIAGTGKLGRNIGRFFVTRGFQVAWLGRDPGRLDDGARRLGRQLRDYPGQTSFHLVGNKLPDCDLVIESIEESLLAKRELLGRLASELPENIPLLSNSSSLLPGELHKRAAGLHFFYPVEMSGFVEFIRPAGFSASLGQRVFMFLAEAKLQIIAEDENHAFAVNRLLLPVQNACFLALTQGAAAPEVDRASSGKWLTVGQLTLMDAIGLDVVQAAVAHYLDRMPAAEAASYAALNQGLAALVGMGKRGQKNHDGLLMGAPLPWSRTPPTALADNFPNLINTIFLNTCDNFLASGALNAADLQVAMAGLFGVSYGDAHESSSHP